MTNSRTTQARIKGYFGRGSRIVYPPVDVARFRPGQSGDYYLVLSELISHKRIDMAVDVFSRLGLPLVVAGSGPDLRRLRRPGRAQRALRRPRERRRGGATCSPGVAPFC